jgi:hypothetical protein
VFVRVRGLATLELGVRWQDHEPRFRRVAASANRRARVRQEKPRVLLVVAEHFGYPVGASV